MNAAHKRGRALFLPKRKEMPTQCSTCPFFDTPAFAAVCAKLAASAGMNKPTPKQVEQARRSIKRDVSMLGDFSCHQSVYDDQMTLRDESEWKQCPGATRWFKGQ